MPRFRFPEPEHLVGCTEFTDQPELYSPLLVIEVAKAIPGLWQPLLEVTRRYRQGPTGPHPEFADAWVAAKMAQVLDGKPCVETWFNTPYVQREAFWRGIGMPRKPSRSLVYDAFKELQKHEPAILAAVGQVVAHCRTYDARVGMYWGFDGREAEAHTKLELVDLDALDEEDRAELERQKRDGEDLRPVRLRKISSQDAKTIRSNQADKLELDDRGNVPATAVPAYGEWWEAEGGDIDKVQVKRDDKGRVRILIGGRWYWTRDPDARIRVYADNNGKLTRIWVGYYHIAGICHFTGGTLSVLARSAGVQETKLHPEAFARTRIANGGVLPWATTGDKGLYARDVIAHNTELGVASAIPPRLSSAGVSRERVDAHHVARCRFCGGPTHFLRWRPRSKNNAPRQMFRCAKPRTDDCRKREQTLTYDYDPLRVQPLRRTDPIWHALVAAQHNIEHAHDDRDVRYGVGGASSRTRMKQLGIAPQQLQATVACLVEWLRIAWRMGWLDETAKTRIRARFKLKAKVAKITVENYVDNAAERVAKVHGERFEHGLDDHFGKTAAKLGLGPAAIPKFKPRGTVRRHVRSDPDPPPDDGDDGLSAIEMLTT